MYGKGARVAGAADRLRFAGFCDDRVPRMSAHAAVAQRDRLVAAQHLLHCNVVIRAAAWTEVRNARLFRFTRGQPAKGFSRRHISSTFIFLPFERQDSSCVMVAAKDLRATQRASTMSVTEIRGAVGLVQQRGWSP